MAKGNLPAIAPQNIPGLGHAREQQN